MKNKYLLFAGLFAFASGLSAQTFSDNFDSYTAGSDLGPQSGGNWTTWSGTTGGTDDVPVSSADAHSGANSIYYSSSAQTGGPTDCVRKFGGTYTTGEFDLEAWFKVESGKGAYFNIQGANPIGSIYSVECFMNADQTLTLSNTTDGTVLTGTYPQGAWFKYNLNINLNTNTWEVLINGVSQGTFSNSSNQVWGIDIYPVNSVSPYAAGYYMDDFTTTYTPYTAPTLDAAATDVNILGKLAGANRVPKIQVRNLGTTAITSFDLKVDYNGTQHTDNITGVNIASMAYYSFEFSQAFTLASGSNNMVATVSNVNGSTDDDASDDSKTLVINSIATAVGKVVVAEEGTGTWCGWCPRGTVFMDRFSTVYDGFIAPISVHNSTSDPMTVTVYDNGLALSSFPGAEVDRGTVNDPSSIEPDILSRITVAPTAFIVNGANWDAGTRQLNVSITSTFQAAANSGYKIACVLTEDTVRGTSSGYAQHNYYSSSSQNQDLIDDNGLNWKTLPNPVPAAQMYFNHVARTIVPSFTGQPNSFPATVNSGDVYTLDFSFTLPATWDENHMHIIGMLINPSGKIDNAGNATIAEAVANGYISGDTVITASIQEIDQIDATIKMYPNPAENYTTVALNLKNNQSVSLNLVDMTGKSILSKNYGTLNGAQELTIPTNVLNSGVYFVQVTIGSSTQSMKLMVK